jgi:hypothetical protein
MDNYELTDLGFVADRPGECSICRELWRPGDRIATMPVEFWWPKRRGWGYHKLGHVACVVAERRKAAAAQESAS